MDFDDGQKWQLDVFESHLAFSAAFDPGDVDAESDTTSSSQIRRQSRLGQSLGYHISMMRMASMIIKTESSMASSCYSKHSQQTIGVVILA